MHELPMYSRQKGVFPLHLAPMDSYFCQDECPRYPMTFVIVLEFQGVPDRHVFLESLAEARHRHPLLAALIRPAKRNIPCWVSAGELGPLVDWDTAERALGCPDGEPIDLGREVGLRVWVRTGENSTTVTMQFHHACTDGTGAYRFIGDFLAIYDSRVTAADPAARLFPIEPQSLRDRRIKMANLFHSGTFREIARQAVKYGFELFGRRIEPLQPNQRAVAGRQHRAPFPGILNFTFGRQQFQEIRSSASHYGVTTNDLLLAELFFALDRWNELRGRRGKRLRIMMPTDMRGKSDYEMPAANMTSYTLLTRDRRDLQDAPRLLQGIRQETARIKHYQLGTQFVDAYMAARKYRIATPSLLISRRRCLASAVLSNAGDPSRRFVARLHRQAGKIEAGGLLLNRITGVPPIRPNTRTISVSTYGRVLTLSLRCDPYLFSLDDTRQFLQLYADRIGLHVAAAQAA